MIELTEKEIEKLNRGRTVRAEAQVLLPLLTQKKAAAVDRLIAHFRAGQSEMLLTVAAEISVLSGLESDLNKSIRETENLERKIYGETTI